jgi:hemolysin III
LSNFLDINNEEFWNTITHLFGLIMVIIGIPFLFIYDNELTYLSKLSLILFSLGLILVYLSSTLYHYITDIQLKRKFQIFDHISIYYLILGSYAPVCLITLYNSSGFIIFLIISLLAVTGTFIKIFSKQKIDNISLLVYLIMGWLIIFDIQTLFELISFNAKILLIASGLSYTIGVFFYYFDRIKFFHSIWHIFVLNGSLLHYIFVLIYII